MTLPDSAFTGGDIGKPRCNCQPGMYNALCPVHYEFDQSDRYASECDLCETDAGLHLASCPNNPLFVGKAPPKERMTEWDLMMVTKEVRYRISGHPKLTSEWEDRYDVDTKDTSGPIGQGVDFHLDDYPAETRALFDRDSRQDIQQDAFEAAREVIVTDLQLLTDRWVRHYPFLVALEALSTKDSNT